MLEHNGNKIQTDDGKIAIIDEITLATKKFTAVDLVATALEATTIEINGGNINAMTSLTCADIAVTNIVLTGIAKKSSAAYALGAGALPITVDTIYLTTGGAEALTLADGVAGQEITIIMVVDGGDGTLTPDHYGNGTTLTFDNNDTAVLSFDGTSWWNVGTPTATVA